MDNEVKKELERLVPDAVKTLEEILNDRTVDPKIRTRAAWTLMQYIKRSEKER